MEELLKDLREVCERHGIEVIVDSASLELGYDGEIVFRCVDLNRRKMCENRVIEMIEELQMYRFMVGDLDIVGVDVGEGKDYTSQVFLHGKEVKWDKPIDTLFIKPAMEEEMKRYARLCDIIMPLHMEPIFLRDSLKGVCKSIEECSLLMCRIEALKVSGKRRKTTYKTIRRDCAKRNRKK